MKEEELTNLRLEIELLKMQNNLLNDELIKINNDFNYYKKNCLEKKVEIKQIMYDYGIYKKELDFVNRLFKYSILWNINRGELDDTNYEVRSNFIFGDNKLIIAKKKKAINSNDLYKNILFDYNRFGINSIIKTKIIDSITSKEKANIITELAKEVRKKYPARSFDICVLSWLAFCFDPKPFRLKWFILRCVDDKRFNFVKYIYSEFKQLLDLSEKEEEKILSLRNEIDEYDKKILYDVESTNKKILAQLKLVFDEIVDIEKYNKEWNINNKLKQEEDLYKREISDRSHLSKLLDEFYFYRKNEFENILVQNYLFNELSKKSFLSSGKTFNDYNISFDYDFLTIIFDYIISGNYSLIFEFGMTKYSVFLQKACSVIYKNGKENKIKYIAIDNEIHKTTDKIEEESSITKFYVRMKDFIISENELFTFYDCNEIFREESQKIEHKEKEVMVILNNGQKELLDHNYYIFLQLFLIYFAKSKITIIIDNYDKEVTKNIISRWINECKIYDISANFVEKQLLSKNIAVFKINE